MQDLGVRFTPGPLADRVAEQLIAHVGPSAGVRVLDPACGEGELLLAIWRALGPSGEIAAEDRFGIEIDPEKARRARERLVEEIGGEAGSAAAGNVRTADGLDPAADWPEATHVLANPPWVSLSGRQSARIPEALRAE